MTYILMFLTWAVIGFVGFAFILATFFKDKDSDPSLPLGILILIISGPIIWGLFLVGVFNPDGMADDDDGYNTYPDDDEYYDDDDEDEVDED